MSEKIIHTTLFGNYEELKDPTVVTPGWKYICITDQEIKSDIWEIIKSETPTDQQHQSRAVKIHFHIHYPKSECLLWLDASFQINTNLDHFWNKHYKGGITAPRHPARACAYREAQVCMRRGLDADRVQKQSMKYANQGMPYNTGLISSGILMRDNSEPVKEFCKMWWDEIVNGSNRDQISFAYCDWKMPGVAHMFNYDYRVRQEFVYTKHYNRR